MGLMYVHFSFYSEQQFIAVIIRRTWEPPISAPVGTRATTATFKKKKKYEKWLFFLETK